MSRTSRRYRCKSYKRIKIQQGESRHHLKPRSRGGSDHPNNISVVKRTEHQAWHHIFSNLDAYAIAEIINQKWLDPRFKFVVQIVGG